VHSWNRRRDNDRYARRRFRAEYIAHFIPRNLAADIAERGKSWPRAAAPITRQRYGLIIAIDGRKRSRISLRNVRSPAQIILFDCRFHFFFLSLEMRFESLSDSKNKLCHGLLLQCPCQVAKESYK